MVCGDNSANRLEEECDGNDLQNRQCTDFDQYTGGTLECRSNCEYDLTQCTGQPRCGDNAINVFGEDCDTSDLDNKDCLDFGYEGGTLACSQDCTFNTANCIEVLPKVCGDDIVNQAWEECDGTDLQNRQCTGFDEYIGGTLGCLSDCTYLFIGCEKSTEPYCGDRIVSPGLNEQCDVGTWEETISCQDFDRFTGGGLACTDCQFDTTNCIREMLYKVILNSLTTPTNAPSVLISGIVVNKNTGLPVSGVKVNIEIDGRLFKQITVAESFSERYSFATANKQYIITAYPVEDDGFRGEVDAKGVWYITTIPQFDIYPNQFDNYANVNEILMTTVQVNDALLSIIEKALYFLPRSIIYTLEDVEDMPCDFTNNCRKFRIPISLATPLNEQGTYNFDYTVSDSLQQALRSHSFKIDRTAPQIRITLPEVFSNEQSEASLYGLYTEEAYLDFTGTISGLYIDTKEDATPIQNIQTKENCGTGLVCFNSRINLQSGENLVTFEVRDREGLTGSRTVKIIKKPTTPFFVRITSHTDGIIEYYPQTIVSGEFNYNSEDVDYINVLVNGMSVGEAYISGQGFSKTIALQEGENLVVVELHDKWKDIIIDSVNVVFDSSALRFEPGIDCVIGQSQPYYSWCTSITVSSTIESPRNTIVILTLRNSAGITTVGEWSFAADAVKSFAISVPLEEGSNIITITAIDTLQIPASTSIEVIRDTIPPIVTITKPANNTATNKLSTSYIDGIRGTWQDANINKIEIANKETQRRYLIESPVGRGSGSYFQDVNLTGGNNTVTVAAYDMVNSEDSLFIKIVLDTDIPFVTITDVQPATKIDSKYMTNAATVTISGTWYDNGDISFIRQEGTSRTATIDYNAKTFVINVNLASGNNTLALVIEDKAGNINSDSVVIELDRIPPEITSFSPSSRTSRYSKPTIDITTSESASCKIEYPSGEILGTFTQGFTTQDGMFHTVTLQYSLPIATTGNMKRTSYIYITCKDSFENSRTVRESFTVDLKPPIINSFEALNSLLNSETENVKNYVLAGDPVTQLKLVTDEETRCRYSQYVSTEAPPLQTYGELSTEFSGFDFYSLVPMSLPIEGLIDGLTYTFYIACEDKGGLTTDTKTINIEVNQNLPIQMLDIYPMPNGFINNNQPTAYLKTLRDVECRISSADLWVYEQSTRTFRRDALMLFNPTTKEHTARLTSARDTFAPLADNIYSLAISCSDPRGRLLPALEQFTFTVDTILPVVTLTSPQNGTITNNALITVSGTVTEVNPDNYMIYVNGIGKLPEPKPLIGNSFSEEITLEEGTEIKVVVDDKATNQGEISVEVNYDNIGPTVTIISPNNYGPFKEVTEIIAKLTENIAGGGVDLDSSYIILKDSSSAIIPMTKSMLPEVNTLVYTIDQALADGEYEITVYPYDLAGNEGQIARAWFKISSVCPTIIILTPLNNLYSKDIFTIWFNGTITTDLTITDAKLVLDYGTQDGKIDSGDRLINLRGTPTSWLYPLDANGFFGVKPGVVQPLEEGYKSYFITVATQQLDFSCQSASQFLHIDVTGPIPIITVQTGREVNETS